MDGGHDIIRPVFDRHIKMIPIYMFYLYVKFDEIHFSSFKSFQRHDLTLNPACDPDLEQKNLTFDSEMSSHYCLTLQEV